jgi:hypothetical protein
MNIVISWLYLSADNFFSAEGQEIQENLLSYGHLIAATKMGVPM